MKNLRMGTFDEELMYRYIWHIVEALRNRFDLNNWLNLSGNDY